MLKSNPIIIGHEPVIFKQNNEDIMKHSNDNSIDCDQVEFENVKLVDKAENNRSLCPESPLIHTNITCDEANPNNSEFKQNVPNEFISWTCKFCEYTDNLCDTAVCIVCYRINKSIKRTHDLVIPEFYRLLELEENNNFIPNLDEFQCEICLEMIEKNNGVTLRGCLHNVCLICIRTYIESYEQPEIKCPYNKCTSILQDCEINTLVSYQVYSRHLDTSLRVAKGQIKDGYQCCIPNCNGWWIFTEGCYAYNCPVCHTSNCISCKATHPNISCKTYQDNLFYTKDQNGIEIRILLEHMLLSGKAEHCPECNIIIVKNEGCLHMICTMCKRNFNWGDRPGHRFNIR